MDLDEMWCKEFENMLKLRKANSGILNLYEVPVPDDVLGVVNHNKLVMLSDITEEYYEKLNNSTVFVWNHGELIKRKYDNTGKPMKDKYGNPILVSVPKPDNCIAILSKTSIGVPQKFKSEEGFDFVDIISRTNDDGSKEKYLVYIIPKKYCYEINQTALILTTNKYRVYYQGIQVALTNGNKLYVYIIPYKPTNKESRNYRLLATKDDCDYTRELSSLRDYWIQNGIIFNPQLCECLGGYKGRDNMAIETLPVVMEEYRRYDENKSMDVTSNANTEFSWDDELDKDLNEDME